MALSQERIGQIALKVLRYKIIHGEEGIRLNPKDIKREVMNGSKKFDIPPHEAAEFIKMMIKEAYDKTMVVLDSINDATDQVEGD